MTNYEYHQPAEQVLFESCKKGNRNKNRLLCLAVTLTVSVIFCILSLVYGKLQVDVQKNIRADGMSVSAYIENGTEEMTQQLGSLSYISETGKQKFAGKLLSQNLKYCDCVVADESTFQKMLAPAYTQIAGKYPKREQDIMLSTKTLEYLGISDPQIGMEVELDFYWNDVFHTEGTGLQKFTLSGYFTEYQNQGASSSVAFLSEQKLIENKMTWNPCRILLDVKETSASGLQMEQKLTKDVELQEGQRVISRDSAVYRAMEGMAGSYGFAAVLSFLTLLCMFLFVSNILNLSLEKDLQQYGLLEVIGVQPKQIVRTMFRQMLEIVLKGSFLGGLAGSFLVLGALPYLVKTMYLEQAGELEGIHLFQPAFLLIAIIPAAFTAGVAVLLVKRKLNNLSPLECMKYEEASLQKKETHPTHQRYRSWGRYPEIYLAKRYLFRNKRAFFITIISLTMGCGLALWSAVMVRGVDLKNRYLKEPDFRISLTPEACITLMETSPDTEHMVFFPKGLLEEVQKIAGDSIQDEVQIQGFYPIIGKNGREGIRLLHGSDEQNTVIQKINSQEKEKLQSFVAKQDMPVDWETFEHGKGTLLLHEHQISEENEERAVKQIGEEIEVYDLVPVGTEMAGLTPETLINCGYVDRMDEAFPELELCWEGKDTNILLVTEEIYQELSKHLTPQIFAISFNVDGRQENSMKASFKELLRSANMEFQSERGYDENLNLLQMECKSDLLLKEQNDIQTSRWFLLAVSACLVFIGILNFLNVRMTDMILRKKECITMENIGMTKKQLYRMFLAEGILTWLILCGLLLTVGTLLLYGAGWYMKTKISYFVFVYPFKEMVFILLILLAGNVLMPRVFGKRILKKSEK